MKKIFALLLAFIFVFSFSACGQDSEKLVSIVENETVTLKAQENVFPENTVVTAEKVTEGENYTTAANVLKKSANKFEVYDITAKSDNVTVQPNGKVEATFDIPESFDVNSVGVVYISIKGIIEYVPSVVDKENNTVTAQLDHFSLYAVIEYTHDDPDNTQSDATTNEKVESEETSSVESTPEVSSKPNDANSKVPETSQAVICIHKYSDATCTAPKTCSLCKKTDGKALGHNYIEGVCERCKAADKTYKSLTSDVWTVQAILNDKLYDYEFCFGNEEPGMSIGIGDNIKDFDQAFKDEILSGVYGDSVYTINGNTYYVGMGDGGPISFTVNKNTVVVNDVDGGDSITMERTSGTTYIVTATKTNANGNFAALKKGSIITWEKAEIAEE